MSKLYPNPFYLDGNKPHTLIKIIFINLITWLIILLLISSFNFPTTQYNVFETNKSVNISDSHDISIRFKLQEYSFDFRKYVGLSGVYMHVFNDTVGIFYQDLSVVKIVQFNNSTVYIDDLVFRVKFGNISNGYIFA